MSKNKKQTEIKIYHDQYSLDAVIEYFIKDFEWGGAKIIGETEYFIDPIKKVVIFKTLIEE